MLASTKKEIQFFAFWTLVLFPFARGFQTTQGRVLRRSLQEDNAPAAESVAVVGGGISGLTAAYELEKKGYSVTVFEALDRVGGKIESLELEKGAPTNSFVNMTEELKEASMAFCGGKSYTEMGAVYISPDTLPFEYADELGVPYGLAPFNDYVVVSLGGQSLRLTNQEYLGLLIQQTSPNATQAEIGAMAMEQVNNFNTAFAMFAEHINSYTLFDQADTDLAMTLPDFAAKYGFSQYAEALRPLWAGWGFGYFDNVAAASPLKLLGDPATGSPGWNAFTCGIQSLPNAIADSLKDVRLNAAVTRVHKLDNGMIEVQAEGQDDQAFDKVIFATTLDIVPSMMTLDPEIKELFSKLQTVRYVATVIDQVGNDNQQSVEFYAAGGYEANQDTITAVLFSGDPAVNAEVAYQLAAHNNSLPEVHGRLEADLSYYWGANMTELIFWRDWTNFYPHVTPETFAAGFYDQVEALGRTESTMLEANWAWRPSLMLWAVLETWSCASLVMFCQQTQRKNLMKVLWTTLRTSSAEKLPVMQKRNLMTFLLLLLVVCWRPSVCLSFLS